MKDNRVQIGIRIDNNLLKQVKHMVIDNETSINDLVVGLLTIELEKHNK